MNKNSRSSDFNLFISSDVTFGTLEAIGEKMADVPTDEPERTEWVNAITGLASAGLKAAREMNAFLYEASDMHRFPSTYADIVVEKNCIREPAPPLYLASRSRTIKA